MTELVKKNFGNRSSGIAVDPFILLSFSETTILVRLEIVHNAVDGFRSHPGMGSMSGNVRLPAVAGEW